MLTLLPFARSVRSSSPGIGSGIGVTSWYISLALGGGVQEMDKVALGCIGAAGTISKGESELRTILAQPDAATQLEKMLPHATDAGRLYVLVGLRVCDRSAYKRAFD